MYDLDEPMDRYHYLRKLTTHQGMSKVVNRVVKQLEPLKSEFDSIAFRGLSGGLVVPSIALLLKKRIIAVRKTTKDCHSRHLVEGHKSKRYIIVDDGVSTGTTLTEIQKLIYDSTLVGVVLHYEKSFNFMARCFANDNNVWMMNARSKKPSFNISIHRRIKCL